MTIELCHRCDEVGVETPANGGILCDACRDACRRDPAQAPAVPVGGRVLE